MKKIAISMMLLAASSLPAFAVMPVSPPRLSKEALENMTYHAGLSDTDDPVKLVKGKHDYPKGEGYVEIEKIVWGDLNGDGYEDAAVQLVENGGGTGYFRSLQIVLNQKGKAVLQPPNLPLGDRSQIKQLTVQGGVITLKMIVAGPNDGACCPTLPVTEKYKFVGQKLVKQNP